MFEITNTKLNIIKNNKILAYATITLNDCIIVSGIRLYEGNKGRFIVFPKRTSKNGKKYNVAFPCKDELREAILQEIEVEYLNQILKQG